MKKWQQALLVATAATAMAGCAREQYVVTDKADNKIVVHDMRCSDSLRVMMFDPNRELDMKYYAAIQPGDTLALGRLYTLENVLVTYPGVGVAAEIIIARINGMRMLDIEKRNKQRQQYNQRDSLVRAMRQNNR